MERKPRLNFWQIWNMNFGFLGIQYGFGLQQANMSPIYSYLNAEPDKIPLLWLAGPVTGLLIQPIIGSMSDRTWTSLGRRRPYFLVGAIISTICLILMPQSSALWMAAGLMWVMDAGFNVTMEPFRAFVGDMLPDEQRTFGFSLQSFFVGLGQSLANLMPWVFANILGVVGATASGIPYTVFYAFWIGAAVFMLSVLWTVYTTKEYPPEDMEAFKREKANHGILDGFKEIADAFKEMPTTMKSLFWVKFFTWYGFFCYVQYFTLAISHSVFNIEGDKPSEEATIWGNVCFAVWTAATFVWALILPSIARATSRKMTHAISLTVGALGLIAVQFIHDKYMLWAAMAMVGMAWASILSMPYAILAGSIPEKRMGVYMGIFNMFIVIPQIIMMITIPLIYKSLLGNSPMNSVVLCGIFWLLAAGACFLVKDNAGGNNASVSMAGGGH